MTRQQSINAFCKWCIYDPTDRGTWRQQTEACTATECPLHTYRPKSSSKAHRVAVQPHHEVLDA